MNNPIELLLAKAAYESCNDKTLSNECMKIYSSLPELFDRYARKIPDNIIRPLVKRNYNKSLANIKAVSGVYMAYYSDEKLCDDKLYSAIEKTLQNRCKPVIDLIKPIKGPIAMEIQGIIQEQTGVIIKDLGHVLTFYQEKKGIPEPLNKYYEATYNDVFDNMSMVDLDPEEERERDINDYDSANNFYNEYMEAAKDVFGNYFETTLASALTIVSHTTSFEEFNDLRKRGAFTVKLIKADEAGTDPFNNAPFATQRNVLKEGEFLKKIGEDVQKTSSLFDMESYKPYEEFSMLSSVFSRCDTEAEVLMIEEFIRQLYSYATEDIYVDNIIKSVPRLKMKQIVRLAKKSYNSIQSSGIAPAFETEKLLYIHEFINAILREIMFAERETLIKDALNSDNSSKKKGCDSKNNGNEKLLDAIDKLSAENKTLENRCEAAEKAKTRAEKNANSLIYDYEKEIQRLKEKYEPEEETEDAPVEEEEAETSEDEEVQAMTEEEFRDFIKNHKILCWGARPSVINKFSQIFPDMDFMVSDKKITNTMISKYDGVLVKADFTGHSAYYVLRDMLRNLDIPMICLANNWNSEKRFYEAGYRLNKLMQ